MQRELRLAIEFLTQCFGDGQELTLLLTQITESGRLMAFIARHGCDGYLALSGRLLCQKNEKELQKACQAASCEK